MPLESKGPQIIQKIVYRQKYPNAAPSRPLGINQGHLRINSLAPNTIPKGSDFYLSTNIESCEISNGMNSTAETHRALEEDKFKSTQ